MDSFTGGQAVCNSCGNNDPAMFVEDENNQFECLICHTINMGMMSYATEFQEGLTLTKAIKVGVKEKKKKVLDTGTKWTTIEAFETILIDQVKRLIEDCGVEPELEIVIKEKLWSEYKERTESDSCIHPNSRFRDIFFGTNSESPLTIAQNSASKSALESFRKLGNRRYFVKRHRKDNDKPKKRTKPTTDENDSSVSEPSDQAPDACEAHPDSMETDHLSESLAQSAQSSAVPTSDEVLSGSSSDSDYEVAHLDGFDNYHRKKKRLRSEKEKLLVHDLDVLLKKYYHPSTNQSTDETPPQSRTSESTGPVSDNAVDTHDPEEGIEMPIELQYQTKHGEIPLSKMSIWSREMLSEEPRLKEALQERKVAYRSELLVDYITLVKLVSFISLGLRLIQSQYYLADLIRWINEGRIPYFGAYHSLPTQWKLTSDDVVTFYPNYSPCPSTVIIYMSQISRFLGIATIPAPQYENLIERYLIELNLPVKLAPKIKSIFDYIIRTDAQLRSKWECQVFKKSENGYALSVIHENWIGMTILLSVSILFRLDVPIDEHINEISSQYEGDFNLSMWLKHTRAKLDLLDQYHIPSYGQNVSNLLDFNPFVTFYKERITKWRPENGREENRKIISKYCVAWSDKNLRVKLVELFEGLVGNDKTEASRKSWESHPTIYPMKDAVSVLLETNDSRISPKLRELLVLDFTRSGIHFLSDSRMSELSKRYRSNSTKFGASIYATKYDAYHEHLFFLGWPPHQKLILEALSWILFSPVQQLLPIYATLEKALSEDIPHKPRRKRRSWRKKKKSHSDEDDDGPSPHRLIKKEREKFKRTRGSVVIDNHQKNFISDSDSSNIEEQ